MQKLYLLFGGRSTEHEISIRSAKFICDHIDTEQFELIPIGIDKDGEWFKQANTSLKIERNFPFSPQDIEKDAVIFPMLHGTNGEDGRLQGLLDMLEVAYVGCDTTASSIAMDKVLTKKIAAGAGIPIVPFIETQSTNVDIEAVKNEAGWPVFVKPTRAGSAIGVQKVSDENKLASAISNALKYDEYALIEKAIQCKELECAALGGYEPKISAVAEISVVEGDFYDYEAKYQSESAAQSKIPANISHDLSEKIIKFSKLIYKSLKLYGMSRIDFFLSESNNLYFNEVNTIPGFTSISQYPLLWQNAGMSEKEIITNLIYYANERQKNRNKLSIVL